MKICFFNRSYWPDTGATGQLLTELAEDLVRIHGMDVTVVAGYPFNGQAAAREMRNGVSIIRAQGTTFAPRPPVTAYTCSRSDFARSLTERSMTWSAPPATT